MTKRPRNDEELANYDGSKPISLQRRRVWRACEECRRKKVKCDSREPVCSQCAATGAACRWTQTKDRAALSRHYVQELEARLLYMEQLFKQHAPDVEVFPKEGNGIPPQIAKNIPVLAPFPSASRPPESSSAKEDDLDVLGQDKYEDESTLTDHFGQMALDAEGQLRWIGGSSTMTLIETFRSETADLEDDGATPSSDQSQGEPNMLYFPTGLGFGKLRALPSADEVEYPERDLADKLVQAYFDRFHFLLPVLDKPSFLQFYQRLMDNNGRGEQPGVIAVVFAVFAVAARFLDDPRIKSEYPMDPRGTAIIFYERAMMLYIIDHTYTQFAHVQCFALLSVFLASLNRLPQAWLLVGQAVRTAQDLGMHRSPKPLKLTKVEKETRRKVWWCVYGLDRCLAVQLGRPLGVDDNDVDVDLPIPVDDEELPAYYEGTLPERAEPSLMAGFVALTALYKIAGKVLRHVYSTDKLKGNISSDKAAELQKVVDRLDLQLTKWCDSLHPTLRQSPTTPQMISMSAVLCSTYYAVLITLHRNFLPTRRNMMQYVGSTSVPKAVCASRSCIFLATSMNPAIPPSHHLAVFVQSLFSSAIIILLVVMHATERAAADIAMSEVENCVNALETLQSIWPGASKCKELLIELAQITRANLAKIGKPREGRPGHVSRPSLQHSSPSASVRDVGDRDRSPRSQSLTRRNRSRGPASTINGGAARHHPYSVPQTALSTPVHSTPSPPTTYTSPVKRSMEEGRPLTIQATIPPTSTRPHSASPENKTELLDRQFNTAVAQTSYDPSGSSLRYSNLPTFFSDLPMFVNNNPDLAHYAAANGTANAPVINAPVSAVNNWNSMDTAHVPFDAEITQFNSMDFFQSFVPAGPIQGESVSMWDGMPEVFNAEPRIFGLLDGLGEPTMN